ncbi:MAG: alpha/beta fold hydrolase [Gammaproteobacteria bacterium]|nr:alpha/beta fold hydrolase [Gammaproteobacteria bacterium]
MSRLAVEGSRTISFEYYQGQSIRPVVVLSHGWGMNARAWDDVTAGLCDAGFGVLVYDHRACGQSDKDFRDVSIAALGNDVVALCDHLSLTAVVLNGWSLGGAVVVDAASKLGSRLKGLVLTGGATPRYTQADGFPHGGTAADVAGMVAALRADRVAFLHGLYFQGVFAAPVSDVVKEHAFELALQAGPAADASLGALVHIDQRGIMQKLQVPALVITGDQDGVVPPGIAEFASKLLPKGQFAVMKGCGHAPFIEDRATYTKVLHGFLKGITL